MARKQPNAGSHSSGQSDYQALERRLVLLAWLNSLFGYSSNQEMLDDMKQAEEGYDSSGRSYMYHRLLSRGSRVKISTDDLARYDENIRKHLHAINRHRSEPITLRYFQYMAVLYTEVLLDRLFTHRANLTSELNAFVEKYNASRQSGEPSAEPFTENDLNKLAYWMATGSGKTLLMHLNYHQFLHYNRQPLDNILLITPNEGLTEQHLAELERSGIPAQRFDLNRTGFLSADSNLVQVIEITKLVGEKRGQGVSVPVEAFEGYNLIFVDEGHKGSGGEAWRSYREAIGKEGFTFEYSATFGQALSASGNDELTREYAKAILFDYSYRYFYNDGYGKDFYVINLKQDVYQNKTDLLLLANLLSFYQQLHLFESKRESLKPYNLEKPLWIFVGSTVNAVYEERRQKQSDVLTVVEFLHKFISDKQWAQQGIQSILNGNSGLIAPDGQDLFADRFPYLRDMVRSFRNPAQDLYQEILSGVFRAQTSGGLRLVEMKRASGELGLQVSGAQEYFGVINIGDVSAFKKLVEERAPTITISEDVISPSLFSSINTPQTPINILIGARKFMEGWNSWRVSSMGLINVGKGEGSLIIQLFGRGVRLKGKDLSLKRSSALQGNHPEHIKLLETLNIFAVRANYMEQFRNYLEREGVEVEHVEIPVFVGVRKRALKHPLLIPRPEKERSFLDEVTLLLEHDNAIKVRVDLSAKVEVVRSDTTDGEVRSGSEQQIPDELLDWVNWEQVYLELLEYKERKGWKNLIIRPHCLRDTFETLNYTLNADEALFDPSRFEDYRRIQEAVVAILRRYMDIFYRRAREQWESRNMVYQPLTEDDPNLAFNRSSSQSRPAYIVRVSRENSQLIQQIEQLSTQLKKLVEEENGSLPRIYFSQHLYLPLLIEGKPTIHTEPPLLNAHETKFVRDLKAFWQAEKDGLLKGKRIYLLRNLSRGKGVGFFEERGFYPDFILWILEDSKQRIVFIEPHGMLHAKAYIYDEKARLHEELPRIAQQIAQRSQVSYEVELDSYIISATPYDELHKRYNNGQWSKQDFADKHILFPERNSGYDYMQILFKSIGSS